MEQKPFKIREDITFILNQEIKQHNIRNRMSEKEATNPKAISRTAYNMQKESYKLDNARKE